jgi:S-adenosylmethionine/arginine decarboxylase-like enzyme
MKKIEKVRCLRASLYECQTNLYEVKENVLESILNDTAKTINAETVKIISHLYEGCGATSCAIIKDPSGGKASHIIISTYPENYYAAVTIESCVPSNLCGGLLVVCKRLKPMIVIGSYEESSLSPETLPTYKRFKLVRKNVLDKRKLYHSVYS